MSEHVRIDVEGDLAVITIDRAERRNALNADTARALADAVAEVGGSSRVGILTGAGPAFCAGGDLDELERWSAQDPSVIAETLYGSFQLMIRALRNSDAVFIAAVNGPAVGAGMDLALACDLRVAASTARFGEVWVRLGVIPGTGGAWLTQEIAGRTRAAELLLTGDVIDADAALAAGLVNAVVEPERLMDEARSLAERILRHPRDGVVAIKRAFARAANPPLEDALAYAAEIQPGRFTSDEFRAAVKKARQK